MKKIMYGQDCHYHAKFVSHLPAINFPQLFAAIKSSKISSTMSPTKKKPSDTLDQVVKKLSIIAESQQEGVKKAKPVTRSVIKSPLKKVMSKRSMTRSSVKKSVTISPGKESVKKTLVKTG